MSAPRAIFISYARDDLAVAERLAAALRATGLEVWLDQDQLTGGDAWDRKLRAQIRDCALFIPVVSAHTQARREGYFRLEWKLADERTHQMAEGTPFILPVVADDTKERNALAPASFLAAQWTRLPHGEVPPAFCARVRALIADEPPEPGRARAAHRDPHGGSAVAPTQAAPTTNRTPSARRPIFAAVAFALAAVAAWLFLRPGPPASGGASQSGAPPAAATSALPKIEAKSIAVLPFKNQSPDPANAFFTEGVHEDVLTSLFNIRELHVVSRTSVEQYRDTKKTVRQIGEELRVAYVLEGSVQRADNKVRVTGQLIEARTDRHVWARNYDKELRDVFALQTEIARDIASQLQAVISPHEQTLLARQPTASPAAYDLLLQSRAATASTAKKETLLQAAVALDPKFAEAWGELAVVHALMHFTNAEHTAERLAKATKAIERAIDLEPEAPEVMRSRGNYYLYAHRDYVRATEQFDRLARVQPNNPDVFYALGQIRQRQANWLAALESFRRATQLDPGNIRYATALAGLLRGGRRWDEAVAAYQRLAELRGNTPLDRYWPAIIRYRSNGSKKEVEEFFARLAPAESDSDEVKRLRLDWARQTGDYAEAIRLDRLYEGKIRSLSDGGFAAAMTMMARGEISGGRERIVDLAQRQRQRVQREPDNTSALHQLGLAEAMLGNREEALRCAARVAQLIPVSFDAVDGAIASNRLANIYTWAGDTDRAIAEATRMLRSPMVYTTVQYMRHDPWWFPLRGDPRFEALLSDPKNNAPLF